MGDGGDVGAVGGEDMAGAQASGAEDAMAVHVEQQPVVRVDRPVEPHGVIQAGGHVRLVPGFVIFGHTFWMRVGDCFHGVAVAEIGQRTQVNPRVVAESARVTSPHE